MIKELICILASQFGQITAVVHRHGDGHIVLLRNVEVIDAVAACGVNAVSCANMALAGVDYAIPCDEVIDAMGRVGSLLSPDLRETGQGGLAATPTGVRIAQTLAEQG